jgi:hypothetical protein
LADSIYRAQVSHVTDKQTRRADLATLDDFTHLFGRALSLILHSPA